MFVFHLVFWLLSVIFIIQLYQIRREQRTIRKKEHYLFKTMVSNNVDNDYNHNKVEKRIVILEKTIEEILKKLRDETDD